MYGCATGKIDRDMSGERMREDQIPVAKMIREHDMDPRLVLNPVIFGPSSWSILISVTIASSNMTPLAMAGSRYAVVMISACAVPSLGK